MPRKKKNANVRLKVYKSNFGINSNFGENIVLTNHLMARARERRDLRGMSELQLRRKLKHEIKNSTMLSISGNEEHRNFQGHMYVIRREKGKMIGITYLISKGRKQTKDFVKYHKAS